MSAPGDRSIYRSRRGAAPCADLSEGTQALRRTADRGCGAEQRRDPQLARPTIGDINTLYPRVLTDYTLTCKVLIPSLADDVMSKSNKPALARIEILQGTLDLIVLQALRWGPRHGYGLVQLIDATTRGVLQVDAGAIYPALHRLERQKFIKAEWK